MSVHSTMNAIAETNEAASVIAAPSHKNVFSALAAAQAEMEMVAKGAINPAFKGEGKPKGTPYADLADVVLAVKGPLSRHGIAFFHQFVPGDTHIMRTVLVHGDTDSRIECDVPLIIGKNDMQGMKSATTYAKRIGLESLTGVAPDDDDGNAAVQAAPARQRPQQRQDEPPPFDPKAAADRIITKLGKAADEGALTEAWDSEAECRREIHAADPQEYERVKKAAADRKAALAEPAPIDMSEVPY